MDVRTITSDCIALITNARLLEVHQDVAGIPGRRLKNFVADGSGGAVAASARGTAGAGAGAVIEAQLWGRPLGQNGAVAVVFFNRGKAARNISGTFADVGVAAHVTTVTTVNVWSGKVTKGVASPITAVDVAAHGVAFLTLTPE